MNGLVVCGVFMSVEDVKGLLLRASEEIWSKWNLAAVDEFMASDFVYHRGTGEHIRGTEEYKKFVSATRSAFPDAHFTIDDIFAEGDKVAARWTMTATHKGELRGIPPTGKKVTMWAISLYRIVEGKIVEAWERYDTLGLMQQLGVIPKPGQGGR
jgi:steroid delta-isomerase-like uncharacterized protein